VSWGFAAIGFEAFSYPLLGELDEGQLEDQALHQSQALMQKKEIDEV
jgi:hypothetical protein